MNTTISKIEIVFNWMPVAGLVCPTTDDFSEAIVASRCDLVNFPQMDLDNAQRTERKLETHENRIMNLRQQNEIHDTKNLFQLNTENGSFRAEIERLLAITALPQSVTLEYHLSLATSSVSVEREIAKCIFEHLPDVPLGKRSVKNILQFLTDYRVVLLLHTGIRVVSLHRIHAILQDNFQSSYLCKFFNIISSRLSNESCVTRYIG